MQHTAPVIFTSFIVALSACASNSKPAEPQACQDPDQLSLPGNDFYPEGVAVGTDGTLYVGAVASGQIVQIPRCGQAQPLVSGLRNVVGLRVDVPRGWLWACNSDLSGQNAPELLAFDLVTGAERARHGFEGDVGFCNDIAINGAGDLYVTDSFNARIMRLASSDVATSAKAQTWSIDPGYEVPAGTFGVNGLDFEGTDLYLVTYETGRMFRVSTAASSPTVQEITLNRSLEEADGLQREAAGRFVVVEGTGRLSRIAIDGNAGQVSVIHEGLDVPTTVALRDDGAWIAEGQFDHLFGQDERAPDPFRIVRVGL